MSCPRDIRNTTLAHGYLARPCPAALLVESIERGRQINAMVDDEALRRLAKAADFDPRGRDASERRLARTAALPAGVGEILLRRLGARAEAERAHEAALGAYLLALWNLPAQIVEAVALQREPLRAGPDFGVVGMTHAATALARGEQPDTAYLEAAGVAVLLPQWQRAHARLVDRSD